MLIAVRAEVENIEHWREQFKTHDDLFKSQGVSIAYMGTTEDNKVIAVFDTNNADEFIKRMHFILSDPYVVRIAGEVSRVFIQERRGATDKIMRHIDSVIKV